MTHARMTHARMTHARRTCAPAGALACRHPRRPQAHPGYLATARSPLAPRYDIPKDLPKNFTHLTGEAGASLVTEDTSSSEIRRRLKPPTSDRQSANFEETERGFLQVHRSIHPQSARARPLFAYLPSPRASYRPFRMYSASPLRPSPLPLT
jgi:hypothetical protein